MPTLTPTPGAVIYARVSTNEQAEHGTSMEGQVAACRAKALFLNLPIIAICEDPGVSGSDYHSRPGIMEALRLMESGAATVLIATKIDRIGRSARVILDIADRVEKAGGELLTGDGNFDKTSHGRFLRTIYAGMAEMERDGIRERMMEGKHRRAQSGQQPQRSRSPYGYHVVTKADVLRDLFPAEQVGRYTIDDATAGTARRIFHEYASGTTSLPQLALTLNAECVPPPGNAQGWHEGTLRVILKNPVYKGQPASGKQRAVTDEARLGQANLLTGRPLTSKETRRRVDPAQWIALSAPPLVTEDVWDAVQARFAVMNARYGGNPKQTRMLSGLTACPFCGGPAITRYQTAHGKPYRYFVCSASRKARWGRKEPVCHSDVYPMLTVEEAAIIAVREAYTRPEAIAEAIRVYRSRARQTPDTTDAVRRERGELDKALALLDAEEQATVQAQVAGMMSGASANAYASLFADIAARRKDLQNRRGVLSQQLTRRPTTPLNESAAEMAQRILDEAWRVLTDPNVTGARKRQIIGTVVQKVICGKEGAKVMFVPGLFGENAGDAEGADAGSRRTCYTTCIGIRTHK